MSNPYNEPYIAPSETSFTLRSMHILTSVTEKRITQIIAVEYQQIVLR